MRGGKYELYQFPWQRGETGVNRSCGVSILLDRHRFSPADVCQVWNAPPQLHGRAGALRVRRRGVYD
eukprot:12124860-Heterocapsa_arctica.AAC.1